MAEDNVLWVVAGTEVEEERAEVEGERYGIDIGGGFGEPLANRIVRAVTQRERVSLDAQALKVQVENMLVIM